MPLADIANVKDQKFDYIIVGGGTAGLLLAARLTEDPSTSVLVLDAGKTNFNDDLILRPGQFGFTFGNAQYDWAFMTTPQTHSNDTRVFWPRGKSLGGSSAINFACWSKPPKEDIDDWEKLGNEGWNWENYDKYNARVSTYYPNEGVTDHKYDPKTTMKVWDKKWGQGEVKISHPRRILDVQVKFHEAFKAAGIPESLAPNNGDVAGCYVAANTLDPVTNDRSYAATAFFLPYQSRANYQVLTGAYGRKIVTTSGDDSELEATGVEFSHDGGVYVAHAGKEVILCAGALKSPQLLELSGIGRPEVLDGLGIPVKVPLNGVGENTQDHTFVGVTLELKDDIPDETYDLLRTPELMSKHAALFKQNDGIFMMGITNFAYLPLSDVSPRATQLLADEKKKIESEKANYPPGLLEQYNIMLERIEKGAPGYEFIGFPGLLSTPNPPIPGKKYLTFIIGSNYMFSRGTVHATTSDPLTEPALDPHYFEHAIDVEIFVDMLRYARNLFKTDPFKGVFGDDPVELNPGPKVQTNEEIIDWVKNCVSSIFRASNPSSPLTRPASTETEIITDVAGSLSMLPKEKNGVVDHKLKVYGTKNIRVADLSVVPLHFSGHSLATAYTIGEAAADIIKGNF